MVTCLLKYELKAGQEAAFEVYGRTWITLVNRFGGHHLGYFMPSEGASDAAYALFTFPSLAAYETYRQQSAQDETCQALFKELPDLVQRYDRTFLRPVLEGTAASRPRPGLVPELAVGDLAASLRFWVGLLGFGVDYQRPEEGFAALVLGGARVMLDQIGLTRTWGTADLEPPLGRGVNFEVSVPRTGPLLDRLSRASWPLFLAPEERWYRAGDREVGVHQFLVQDPDGYLVRCSQTLGTRPTAP